MNRLLIDVGNTNICVAVFSEDEALFVKRLETHEKWNQVSFSEALRQSFREYVIAPESVSGAILSSVVPELNSILVASVRAVCGIRLVIADMSTIPVPIRQYDRTLLGRDRLVDMFAAWSLYHKPAVIYDLGSCSTMSALARDGEFIGGMISAGIEMSLEAEAEKTAQLPRLKAEPVETLLGNDTVANMLSGEVIGTAAMIDGVYERVRDEMRASGDAGEKAFGEEPEVLLIITGGLGKLILPWLRNKYIYEPDLLMKGLLLLAKLHES